MTHHHTESSKLEKSALPTNSLIRQAVIEIASKVDLEETSFKKIQRLVAGKLGVAIEELAPKKDFIKKCLEELEEKESSSNYSAPTENEIREAALKQASKVDLETTTFKKFMKLVEDELDWDDLTSAKSVIQKIYDDGKYRDAKIIKSAKKLAESSKVDLEHISNHEFLSMLQETVSEIDLHPKKDLVYKTLKESKRNHHANKRESIPVEDISSSQPSKNKKFNTRNNVEEVMARSMYHNPSDNTNKKPQEVVRKPKCSLDLEQGCKIPEAAGLKWADDFFEKDTDDLVAVFDHDYEAMFSYGMRLKFLSEILPVFIIVLVIAIIVAMSGSPAGGAVTIVIDLIYTVLCLYGSYRLVKSYVYSLHLAVKRDGVCFVQDDHIEGFSLVAAFHVFDVCIFVSKQSQTIPFDQITELTVKDPGEIDKTLSMWYCCFCCLRVPFHTVGMNTASSSPGYCTSVMDGLSLPHEFQKLVWGMKRDKGEEIHRRTEKNTAAMCSAMMFDNMMKYGMSPVQPPIPGMIDGSGKTAPTMSVSMDSTPSHKTPNHSSHLSSHHSPRQVVDL